MLTRRLNRPQPAAGLAGEMDRLFSEFFSETNPSTPGRILVGRGSPALNVWQSESGYVLEAEVPGFSLDRIEIALEDRTLTIRGERDETVAADGRIVRRERGLHRFARTVRLAEDVDPDRIEATLRDGVLTVTLPKAEHAQPRRIEVRAG